MNQLKQQQAALMQELEKLEESLPQLEAEWRNAPSEFSANGNVIGSPESREAMEKLSSVKARIDAIPGELASIDRKLQHLERSEKIVQIKADAVKAMSDATTEFEALERKKSYLNERFQKFQTEANQALEKAQQAERDAVTYYAKCLASGDTEGEKSASSEMQKAAKQLITTDEQVRKQEMILLALQTEIDNIDVQIKDSQQCVTRAKTEALQAVLLIQEEKWNTVTEKLAAVGAQITAINDFKGGMADPIPRLEVPRFGPFHSTLNSSSLNSAARHISLEDILSI